MNKHLRFMVSLGTCSQKSWYTTRADRGCYKRWEELFSPIRTGEDEGACGPSPEALQEAPHRVAQIK